MKIIKYLTCLTLSLLALSFCSCWIKKKEKKIDWTDYDITMGALFDIYLKGSVNEAKNAIIEMEEHRVAFYEKHDIEKELGYVGEPIFSQTRLYFVYTELGDLERAMKCKARAIQAVNEHDDMREESGGFKQETEEKTWDGLMEIINALDMRNKAKWRGFDKPGKKDSKPNPDPESNSTLPQ